MPEITEAQMDAVNDLLELNSSVWTWNAGTFTCMEANAIAGFLSAFDQQEAAQAFIDAHSLEDDDEGDLHYDPELQEVSV